MLRYRPINLQNDKEIILELQCQINYACDTPYSRKIYPTYEKYRKKWMSTTQTKEFLSRLEKSLKNERTIAKIVEANKKVIGYFWVQFFDVIGYDLTYAEISELAVLPEYQRKGIATKMLSYIEKEVRKKGVKVIRSGTGILNIPSQKLHKKLGYKPIRISYEKIL